MMLTFGNTSLEFVVTPDIVIAVGVTRGVDVVKGAGRDLEEERTMVGEDLRRLFGLQI